MAIRNILRGISRTKTIDITSTESQFKRCLTTFDLTILGVGTMVGSGLYVLTGVVAREIAGPAVILSYIIAGVVSIMAAMCYAEFGSRVPVTGSAYTYTYVTIGEFWAFVIGWNLVLEYVVGAAAVARSWSGYFDELINYQLSNFTKNIIFGGTPLNVPFLAPYPDVFSGLLTAFVLLFVVFGAKISSRVTNITVMINLVVVGFVFIAGLFLSDVSNWSDFFPFGISGVLSGAASCFFAFTGFDVIALSGEEAVDHVRGVPRATGISVVLAGMSYVAVSISLTLMTPFDEIQTNASFSHAFVVQGLFWAKYIVGVGALCAMFTSLLGSLFGIPRSVFAMANDGLLFAFLAKVSARSNVPVVSAVIFGLLSATMAVVFDLSALVEFMSIGVLMAYAVVAGAVIVLRYRPNESFRRLEKSKQDVADLLHGNEEEKFPFKEGNNEIIELIITNSEREGCLKRQFRCLKFLANHEPGTVPCLCLCLTVTFQVLAVVVGVVGLQHVILSEWWVLVLLVVFSVLAVLTAIPIPMHNQTSTGRGYNVPLVPYLPLMSIFCDIVLMAMLRPVTWIRFAVWVGLGLVVYVLYGYRRSVEGRQRAASSGSQHKYEFIAADSVSKSPSLYGAVDLQQSKNKDNTNKTEL